MNTPTIIFTLCAVVIIIILFVFKNKFSNSYAKCLSRSFLLFLFIYVLIQIVVFIKWEFFISPNNSKDTAKNFSFITGAIFSTIISFTYLLINLSITFFKIKKTTDNH